jgi:hypothetical protein
MRLFVLVLFIISSQVFAHPVIYKGGWVYQGTFMPEMNELRLGYSLTSRVAMVANANYFENFDEYQDYTLGFNFLLKRWLGEDSQGNVYLGFHGGLYDQKSRTESESVGHHLLMADWESREHYVVFKSKGYYFEEAEEFDYMFRYGFAPYVAGMNELQTWFILQAYYFEPQSQEVIVTPMLRFFYKNVLWEIGSSTRGQSFISLMVHI